MQGLATSRVRLHHRLVDTIRKLWLWHRFTRKDDRAAIRGINGRRQTRYDTLPVIFAFRIEIRVVFLEQSEELRSGWSESPTVDLALLCMFNTSLAAKKKKSPLTSWHTMTDDV